MQRINCVIVRHLNHSRYYVFCPMNYGKAWHKWIQAPFRLLLQMARVACTQKQIREEQIAAVFEKGKYTLMNCGQTLLHTQTLLTENTALLFMSNSEIIYEELISTCWHNNIWLGNSEAVLGRNAISMTQYIFMRVTWSVLFHIREEWWESTSPFIIEDNGQQNGSSPSSLYRSLF